MKHIIILVIFIFLLGCSSSDNDLSEEFAAGIVDEKLKKSSNKIVRTTGKIGTVSAIVSAINKVEKQRFEREMKMTMDLVERQFILKRRLEFFLNKISKLPKQTIGSLKFVSDYKIDGNLSKIKTGYFKIDNNHLKFDKSTFFEFFNAQMYLSDRNCSKEIKSIKSYELYFSTKMIEKYCKETQTKFHWSYGPNKKNGITIIYNNVAYEF